MGAAQRLKPALPSARARSETVSARRVRRARPAARPQGEAQGSKAQARPDADGLKPPIVLLFIQICVR